MSNDTLPGQYIYAITPAQQAAFETMGWEADPEPVLVPEVGWGITPGDLADRPAASTRLVGTTWFARDEAGGQLSGIDNEDPDDPTWVNLGPAVNDVGGYLITSVAPTSLASINPTAFTATRIPEFTTSSFTMPDRPVRATLSQLGLTTTADPGFIYQIRYTTNAWSSSTTIAQTVQNRFVSNTSFSDNPIVGRVPASAGATVSVALFVTRISGSAAVTAPVADIGGNFIDVIAF